jgi:hypothetical protein
MNRGFARLDLTNMLEPRVEGVGADAGRGSGSGCGFLARCKAAGKQLEGEPARRRAYNFPRGAFQSTDKVDGLLSSS